MYAIVGDGEVYEIDHEGDLPQALMGRDVTYSQVATKPAPVATASAADLPITCWFNVRQIGPLLTNVLF